MSLETLFDIKTDLETERRNRIRIALAAYAYEYENDSIMSDAEYDELSKKIDVSIDTGNKKLDEFFRKEFSPDTGQWIHKHPETDRLAAIYYCLKNPDKKLIRIKNKVYTYGNIDDDPDT